MLLFDQLLKAYESTDATQKCDLMRAAHENFQAGAVFAFKSVKLKTGFPEKPEWVAPRLLPKRGLGSADGRAALWHAIAHIEFNAINLALDACLRFADMPEQYYADWIQVAYEESYHFSLIRSRLKALGYDYGHLNGHKGLWQMCEHTEDDCMVRMATAPRVIDARGLDVTTNMMQKLELAGDDKATEILSIILRDEINHVAVGNRWFKYLCEKRNLHPLDTFEKLSAQYIRGQLKGPYDREARVRAGFDHEEIDWLETHYP